MKEIQEHVSADMLRSRRLTGEGQSIDVKVRQRTTNVTPCQKPPVTITKEERQALHKKRMKAKGHNFKGKVDPTAKKAHPTPNLSRSHKNRGLHARVAYDTPAD